MAETKLPPVPISPAAPHSFHIRKDREFVMYGYSPNCSGCRAARLGLGLQAHSIACRARIEGELSKTEAGRQRLQEHYCHEQNVRPAAIAPEQQTGIATGSSTVREGVSASTASATSATTTTTIGSGPGSGSASSGSGQASASGSGSGSNSSHMQQP